MSNKQKLELTWIGKGEQPKLEPRILIEDKEKSFGDPLSENMLIHGDNLLALRALEQDFAGKIKCIYIDPPFNMGAATDYYDDLMEHSQWLHLMYNRIKVLYNLLSNDGFMIVHLDDTEAAYSKVILDEIFGRANYLNTITVAANSPFGFKHTSKSIFKTANCLFVYAKNASQSQIKTLFKERNYDTAYKYILKDRNVNYCDWTWTTIGDDLALRMGYLTATALKKVLEKTDYEQKVAEYAIENCERVFRTASVTGGALLKRKATIEKSKRNRGKIFIHPNDDMEYYFLNGERILFYDERMQIINGKKRPGEVLTDMWDDISWEGIAKEGGVNFPKGKKPEQLLSRIIHLTTSNGDFVLDSFLGSGTTCAVAHKMNRKWIGTELREHCITHCLPRLKQVVEGIDQGGITKTFNWKGGGGFKYYELAPSLLKQDQHGNWIIDERYNANMLAAAMAKQEGYTYNPNQETYWKQGQSTEKAFIFTTTQFITVETIDKIHEEMQPEESLLVCCKAFQQACNHRHEQITVKKIPNMLLGRCEFGKEDYSLNIINMPRDPNEQSYVPPGPKLEKEQLPSNQTNLFENE